MTRASLWASLIPVMVLMPGMARSQQDEPQTPDSFRIYSNVDLVVLYMTVRDRKGDVVFGMEKNNFTVLEDGISQTIESLSHEDLPATIGLVIDNSGSMSTKRVEVNSAALEFARSSNPQDEIFVVNFNEIVSFGLPSHLPFTNQTRDLEQALSATNPDGRTALYDAISYALEHLKQGQRNKKALIVISDGGDNASNHRLDEILAMAIRSEAILYTMGIFDPDDPDRNPRVLEQLARETGGSAFFPQSLGDVTPACNQIAADIRSQYFATYVPTNRKPDGRYRSIRVRASAPGRGRLFVRTRAGYYAPSNSSSSSRQP